MDRQEFADIWPRVSSSNTLFRSGTVSPVHPAVPAARGRASPPVVRAGTRWTWLGYELVLSRYQRRGIRKAILYSPCYNQARGEVDVFCTEAPSAVLRPPRRYVPCAPRRQPAPSRPRVFEKERHMRQKLNPPCSMRAHQQMQTSATPMCRNQNKCAADEISRVGLSHELRMTHQANTETTISPC
jgi:hypothetical protein